MCVKVKLPECINKNDGLIPYLEQAILEFKVYSGKNWRNKFLSCLEYASMNPRINAHLKVIFVTFTQG